MTPEIGQADVFISYAHEDEEVARPLAEALRQRGLTVWYDEYVLQLGDSLREVIERGLATARFGVVILSPNFFAREWPKRELNALLARETSERSKVLLPVWHNMTAVQIVAHSPILADRLAASTARGLPFIVEQVLQVLQPEKARRAASVSPPTSPITRGSASSKVTLSRENGADRNDRRGALRRFRSPTIAAILTASLIIATILLWRQWHSSVAPSPLVRLQPKHDLPRDPKPVVPSAPAPGEERVRQKDGSVLYVPGGVAALVRISGTRNGTPVRGSGFVVGLDRDRATVVTASHVIEGMQPIDVTFAVDPTESFPAAFVQMESRNSRGLAMFQVRGALPAGVMALSFETEAQLQRGEDLFLLGFPRMATSPLTLRRTFAGPDGNFLQLDQPVGEGFSGAPVLRRGKVVGVVMDEDPQLTFAVKALVARDAVLGWGGKLGEHPTAAPLAAQAAASSAVPVDLNSATQKDLEALPRVGPATAKKIIAGRPYTSVVDLAKAGVPARTIQKITPLVTVGAAAAPPAAPAEQPSGVETAMGAKPVAPPRKAICVTGEEEFTENGVTYVRICAGKFKMSEYPSETYIYLKGVHEVALSEFWISKREITNEQYRRVHPRHQGEAKLPVTEVSWEDAKKACEYLGGRLPTDAEWEYAARAGRPTAWSFGDDVKSLGEYAWYSANSDGAPHPVGTRKPNAWDLYDMHGNVWEWVADWYDDNTEPISNPDYSSYPSGADTDPSGPSVGTDRVVRGGAFDSPPRELQSSNRSSYEPTAMAKNIGFRCSRDSRRQP
ncbi:MAG TPA: SUMF1/EgtB/PvdO family nonheme iron enzyme [Thermoanaerobaculia bacterium]|nr:SUMF1/EgtB/PvdO family nonheme iron enzyme [Thermoanaerobaculia bacterium]